jgi:transposase-like protein
MKKQITKRGFIPMKGTRRKFDKEFKNEAIQLALSGEPSIREVAAGLGILEKPVGRGLRGHERT